VRLATLLISYVIVVFGTFFGGDFESVGLEIFGFFPILYLPDGLSRGADKIGGHKDLMSGAHG
jgi:hypothetical protein